MISTMRGLQILVLCALSGCSAESKTGSRLPQRPSGAPNSRHLTDGGPQSFDNTDGTASPDARVPADASDHAANAPVSCRPVELREMARCRDQAPPKSFSADVQWAWNGDGDRTQSIVIPLVANLTDDNADGAIDLCDVPDIVVTAYAKDPMQGAIFLLDGATGKQHKEFSAPVYAYATPALGDIDGDGQIEIVAVDPDMHVMAFSAQGDVLWASSTPWPMSEGQFGALAIADLNHDGKAEIMAGGMVFDATGRLILQLDDASGSQGIDATVAADLDGDGELEVILGRSAFHLDGSALFKIDQLAGGLPEVADLDGDGEPEIVLQSENGFSLIENDGTVTLAEVRPLSDPPLSNTWLRPGCIHDFSGDRKPEGAFSVGAQYGVFDSHFESRWIAPVMDYSGSASGTAFDFLGNGHPEAMYADEKTLYVFDAQGAVVMQAPRSSRTLIEYPVVADVDNDGSAEIVVVSSETSDGHQTAPTVQVIRDKQDRWVQARRIWNEHTYHVTNVREDGAIPRSEAPSWKQLNTFRANAQIEAGGLCTVTVD